MKISSLEQQKRRRDRVSVFLDGEFWIGITERLCTELGLCVGMEITSESKKAIEEEALEDGALQYAYDRLASGLMPSAKLSQKLQEKGFSDQTADMVLQRCIELHLLDDKLWAETVSEERAQRGQGRRKVETFLRQQGIDEDLILRTMEATFLPEKEEEAAEEVLRSRYRLPLDPPDQRRAYMMLLRRGFSSAAASASVAKLAMNQAEAEDAWGSEEALEILRRRFKQDVSRQKAWDYLRRRAFSPEAIRVALDSFYS